MSRVFFTYVWGAPGEPAWPLTFATRASRTHAKRVLREGDIVFTVGTKGDPTPAGDRGRVLGAFRVSDLEVNTADYALPTHDGPPEFDAIRRFPFALHPISVWAVTTDQNVFSTLAGQLTGRHHLQAQSNIVELDGEAAAALLRLPRREVESATPATAFGEGRVALKNRRLAPAHEGQYVAAFAAHETWYVYTLVLRDARRRPIAVKVGYAHHPSARESAYNGPMASEVTGLAWSVDVQQPVSLEATARDVEQAVLAQFERHRLDTNGEILRDVDPTQVAAAIAVQLRRVRVAPSAAATPAAPLQTRA